MSNIKDYIREVLSGRLDADGSININLAEYNRLHKYFPKECLEVQTELVTEKVIGKTREVLPKVRGLPQQSTPVKTPIRSFGHICLECDGYLKFSWWSAKVLGCKNKNCIQYWKNR